MVTLEALHKRANSLKEPGKRRRLHAFIDEERHQVELSTIASRMDAILALGHYLGKRPWTKVKREDIIHVIASHRSLQGAHLRRHAAEGKPLADSTKFQWYIFLLGFYKWLLNTEDKPPQFRMLPFRKVDLTAARIKVMTLKPLEVRKLLAGAETPRDKAIIIAALEGGFRASELAALRLDFLQQRNHGIWLELPPDEPLLKTKPREVSIPIVAGKRIIEAWLKVHPRINDPAAPLFVTQSARSQGKRMNGAGIGAVITRCAKRAGLRHIHAHMLRHTSTGFKIARGMSPTAIRYVHGWTKKSTMLGYYEDARQFFEHGSAGARP